MKKILTFILAISMLFIFTACKRDNLLPDNNGDTNSDTNSDANGDTNSDANGDTNSDANGDTNSDTNSDANSGTNSDANSGTKDDEEALRQAKIEEILLKMSLEDKIGQMFIVGFEGTTVPKSLDNALKNQRFGNFIYFGANVADDSKVRSMSDTLQSKVKSEIGIPAFIFMDQEGGMVVRFAEAATHFIGNMGLVATNKASNASEVGLRLGNELKHFGINMNLAPSLDVNNNPANPIIGIRSYSDKASVVSEYGLQMISGLRAANVAAVVKHFPGHGDTSIDSHYGLPKISHDLNRLYEVELAPFIAAIEDGVDFIMTTHIIFEAIDATYPATLSYKVLTELLRGELGYDGVIMTDEMRMSAIKSNFGEGPAAVMAVKAGVDMLIYAESTSTSIKAYDAILAAVKSGEISEAQIDASLRRILDKKFKLGLFEDNLDFSLSQNDFNNNREFSRELIKDSLTLAKGSLDWFSKTKKTLLISTVCTRYPLVSGYSINTNQNSLAIVGASYLQKEGVNTVDSVVIGTSLSQSEIKKIITQAQGYEQVIIAVEDVKASQASLINALAEEDFNLLVIALKNPYDYLSYTGVQNYLCTYGYFADSVYLSLDLILGKFSASGVLPVKVVGLN